VRTYALLAENVLQQRGTREYFSSCIRYMFFVQVLFLAELEEIIDIVPVNEFARIVTRVCRQLARCVGSWHFQVRTVCNAYSELSSF